MVMDGAGKNGQEGSAVIADRYDANGLLVPFDPVTEMAGAVKHVEVVQNALRNLMVTTWSLPAVCGHRKGRP